MISGKNGDSVQKVLVLGSSGFVGKSIVDALSKVDLFAINALSSKDVDLTDEGLVKSKLPAPIQGAVLIMAAAITRDKDRSIRAMMNNIKMDSNIANLLAEYPPSHLIYISSIDVYGRENLILPLDEESKLQPSNYYAISKMCGEFIFKAACSENNIPFTVLRLTALYGPGDTHKSPIKMFIFNALQGKTVTVRGNGSEKRDFLYIKDTGMVVRFIIQNKIQGVYNVVTGKSVRINYALTMIQELCGHSLDIAYDSGNKDWDLIFSESTLFKVLPGLKFTELKTGLRETYESENIGH